MVSINLDGFHTLGVTVEKRHRTDTIRKSRSSIWAGENVFTKSRDNHLYVACWCICNHDQVFWSAKSVLDHLIVPFWGSSSLDFEGSKVKLQLCILDPLILAVPRSPWSLDRPPKRIWSLHSILIPVTNVSTQHVAISDFPCWMQRSQLWCRVGWYTGSMILAVLTVLLSQAEIAE